MTAPEDADITIRRHGTRLQFSVRGLLLLTLAIACILPALIVISRPVMTAVIICLSITLPAMLTMGVLHQTGDVRIFCVGALFPSGVLLYVTGWLLGLSTMRGPSGNKVNTLARWLQLLDDFAIPYIGYAVAAWILSVVVGLMCVGIRRSSTITDSRRQLET